jgi:hypothetical protein
MDPVEGPPRDDGAGGVTGLLGSVADRARRVATDGAEAYRRSSRHQRLRLGVIGGWILVSVLAVWIAFPSSGPTNSLGADVHVLRESLVGGEQILVRNESEEIWTDVVLTLDGSWRNEQRTLRPRDQVVLSPSQFRRGDEVAPQDLRPRTLTIQCRQGRARIDLR